MRRLADRADRQYLPSLQSPMLHEAQKYVVFKNDLILNIITAIPDINFYDVSSLSPGVGQLSRSDTILTNLWQ